MSADPLATYLDLLFGAEPVGAFLEVRWRLPDRRGMGQLWQPVESKATAIDSMRSIGARTDLYIGCAPRTRRYGGKDAIKRSHVLWADLDSPESIAAVERFAPGPSMVIRSGSGRHAYWSIFPGDIADVERANRRLAHVLGADMVATDAARILRPPGTRNFKADLQVPVEVEHLALEVYTLDQVAGELPNPPERERPARRAVPLSAPSDDPLLTIAPPVYVELLTGREIGRDGKVSCPFHDERTPSLHVYHDPERGWTCFGCPPAPGGRPRGGKLIDFGAHLYGIEPRGAGYWEIRRRLATDLLARARA